MFCDCSCDTKIPLQKLPAPEDLPNILFSANYDLVGTIDALPRVNKDFYSDFEVVDKTATFYGLNMTYSLRSIINI